MKRNQLPTLLIILLAVFVVGFLLLSNRTFDLPEGETVRITEPEDQIENEALETQVKDASDATVATVQPRSRGSSREILETDGVRHSIPLDEIRRGCFGRDCIPSVDEPEFISAQEADELLPEDTVGIGLTYNGETRFYPFNMLVTREIVNDTVAGDPLAVTYCPLCGTGVVFGREIDGEVFEFGVSGLLWQSNLLMYNRAESEDEISLWSQVLGEAVLGEHTGTVLPIVPSDITRFKAWSQEHPDTRVLNTGRIGDPYNGDYYGVARNFDPDFDEDASPLEPTAQVLGIEIDGQFKAYPKEQIPQGQTTDSFVGEEITINRDGERIRFFTEDSAEPLPTVSGFWFSWVSAHPETELFSN